MTDVFTDVTKSEDSTSDDSSNDTNTDDEEVTTITDTFTDAVRTTVPQSDDIRDTNRYEDPDSDEKADDVDPRNLFRQPDLNEIRYYAREGPYGSTIIHKPLRDAFKHGFDVEGDNTENEDGKGKIESFLDEYEEHYKLAETKSRRDGLAVLMFQTADGAESVADPIPDEDRQRGTATHEGFQLWTVDNLSDELSDTTVARHTEYDQDQIYVSEGVENGGVAIVDDVSHPDHGSVVGYGVLPRQDSEDVQDVAFVHASRCQHFVWHDHVDGDVGNNVTGKHVGESILTSVLQPLKAAQMGFWAVKNILFRYSAPLHAVEPPDSWGKDDWDEAEENLGNISMASDAMLPPGSELNVADGVSEFDPQPIYEVLHESICSGTIFTKSVLRGTQTGTVSGSETDIKGYFTEVQNFRQQRAENKFREAVRMVSSYDQSTIPRVAGVDTFDVNWGPLLKPTDIEQKDGAASLITAVTNGIKNYVLTPDEARSIVSEEWAEFDIDVDLDELEEDDWDSLDRINMNEAGQGIHDNEPVNQENVRENPQLRNGGGQPSGQNRESSQPQRTSQDSGVDLDSLSKEELHDELERRRGD